LGALDRNFDALAHSGSLGCGDGSQSLILRLFAGFAPLGFVLQSLIMEKGLLA
jgi:hypothetical protein